VTRRHGRNIEIISSFDFPRNVQEKTKCTERFGSSNTKRRFREKAVEERSPVMKFDIDLHLQGRVLVRREASWSSGRW